MTGIQIRFDEIVALPSDRLLCILQYKVFVGPVIASKLIPCESWKQIKMRVPPLSVRLVGI